MIKFVCRKCTPPCFLQFNTIGEWSEEDLRELTCPFDSIVAQWRLDRE